MWSQKNLKTRDVTEATSLLGRHIITVNNTSERTSLTMSPDEEVQILSLDPSPLTSGQMLKRILSYGSFTALSFTFSMSLGVIGLWGPHVAKHESETDVLAALNLITNMKQFVSGATITSLYAMSILGSVAVGELRRGDTSQRIEIGKIYRNGVLWGLTISAPMSLLFYFSKNVLMALGQPHQAAVIAQSYLRPYTPALPLAALRICGQEILLAFEKPKTAMMLTLPTLAIAIGFAAFLIYRLDMGLEGLAYGLLTETALSAILMNAYILMGKGELSNVPFLKSFVSHYDSFFKDMATFLKVGLGVSLQITGFFLADILTNIFAGHFGSEALAAQNFVTQFSFMLVIPIIAFGQSIMQEVGRLRGSREFENASWYARLGLLSITALIATPSIAVLVYPQIILDIFSKSPSAKVTKIASTLLRIASVGRIADAALYNMVQVSRQAGDQSIPTVIALLETLGIGIGTGCLLGYFTDLDVYGINIGYFGGLTLSAASLAHRWWKNTNSERFEHVQDVKEGIAEPEPSYWQSCCSSARSYCGFFSGGTDESTDGPENISELGTSSGFAL